MSNKRPHILIFNPDQMRSDTLHHLGNEASYTPNIDAILEDGVSFSNAFCQNPVCTPSRCSFMSGLYPHVNGHRTISHLLHEDEDMLLKELKDEGYYVWTNNRNDLVAGQFEGLYESTFSENSKPTTNITRISKFDNLGVPENIYSFFKGIFDTEDEIVHDSDIDDVLQLQEFIENRIPEDKPACMFIGFMNPHPPYQVEKKFYDKIAKDKLQERILPPTDWSTKPSILKMIHEEQKTDNMTEEDWKEMRTVYLGMCAKIDYMYGQIVESLKKAGIYDDTAIFFLSDHGDYTGDFGVVEKTQNTFEDCLVNVPFLIKPPKWMDVKPGVNDSLVELVDLYATVEELTGMKPTHTHFGKSLIDVVSGKVDTHRDVVFSEGGRLKEERHCTESANLPFFLSPKFMYYPRMKAQNSDGPEHTKATMIRDHKFKYVKRLDENDELYDLTNDTNEEHNLINNEEYQSIIVDYKLKMLDWLQRTADIVPFTEDARFSRSTIIDRIKATVGEEEFKALNIPDDMPLDQLTMMMFMGAKQEE